MNTPVVDASVAIKWFMWEDGTEEALDLLDQISSFYVPDLFLIEIDAVLTKRVRKRAMRAAESHNKRAVFRQLPFRKIPYIEIEEFAFRLATEFPITLCDATYVAIAVDYDLKLYTADKRLYNGMSETPFNQHIEKIQY